MIDDLAKMFGSLSPKIGLALGGPVGGAIGLGVQTLINSITGEEEPEKALAVLKANPDKLVELEKHVTQMETEQLRIHANDRDSARKMQIENKSWIVPVLAMLTVGGFFAVLGFVITGRVPVDSTITGVVIGAISSKAEQVYNFFFGSSKGSKDKTSLMKK